MMVRGAVRTAALLLAMLAAASVATSVAAGAAAGPGTAGGALDAWELIHPGDLDAGNREHRHAVARDLRQRVELMAAVVPPLAPNRAARVAEEQARLVALGEEASPRRRSRLYLSRDYQHARLLRILGEAMAALDCVTGSGDDLRREMACWARASTQFLDQESISVALAALRRARLVPRDEDMPVAAMDPVVWYGEYGRGIVTHILTPYLDAEAAP